MEMNIYHRNELLRILDGNMRDVNKYRSGKSEDWQPTTAPMPDKWGLRDMVTEIYNVQPRIYKDALSSIVFREPNRLGFYWEDIHNSDKEVKDANGRYVGEQYLRVSDILSIMGQYVRIITFDMDAEGYADINFTETGTDSERVSLSFEFEVEPH